MTRPGDDGPRLSATIWLLINDDHQLLTIIIFRKIIMNPGESPGAKLAKGGCKLIAILAADSCCSICTPFGQDSR